MAIGHIIEHEHEPSTFEAVTRAQLDALRADVAELKGRVNGLLWAVAAAVVVEVVKMVMH